jgi:citrate synthase
VLSAATVAAVNVSGTVAIIARLKYLSGRKLFRRKVYSQRKMRSIFTTCSRYIDRTLLASGGRDMSNRDKANSPVSEDRDGEYLSAKEAAKALGISVQTLYVYVSRKGIHSQPIVGSRERRYWRPDIERLIGQKSASPPAVGRLRQESRITLITNSGLFYRGHNAAELAAHASFESVASLLWGFPEEAVFTNAAPLTPAGFSAIQRALSGHSEINRATAILPLFEEADSKAHDLSPLGMARTGAAVLRTLAALAVGSDRPSTESIHDFIARQIGANALQRDLIRRQLVLAADHGFEPGTVAVRVIAGTGVTPWRSVIAGLSVILGCRPRQGGWSAVSRLLAEILASSDPTLPVAQRIRLGEYVPGFHTPVHSSGDPRARSLLEFCASAFSRDPSYRKLAAAITAAKDLHGLEPNFTLAFLFVDGKTGVDFNHSLFPVGRCAGWIAHAIEQYQSGEPERILSVYKGDPSRQMVEHQAFRGYEDANRN